MNLNIKAQSTPKKLIFSVITILLVCMGVWFVSSQIDFTPVYPTINLTENNSANPFVNISTNFSTDSLQQFNYTFDSLTYKIYDSSLTHLFNLDNRTELGEGNNLMVGASIYNYNATFINSSNWTSNGKYGGAIYLNGTNYLNLSNTFNNQNFTISLWVKPTFVGAGHQAIFSDNGWNFYSRITAGVGDEYFTFRNSTGTIFTSNHNFVYLNNTWVYYAISFNNISRIYSVYKNGSLIYNSSVNFTNNFLIGVTDLLIGSGPENKFIGYIDNIKIYNKTLNNIEIYNDYSSVLIKYNSTFWGYEVNQSLNYSSLLINASSPMKILNYNFCANNGTDICSNTMKITQLGYFAPQIINRNNNLLLTTLNSTVNFSYDVIGAGIQNISVGYKSNNNLTCNLNNEISTLESGNFSCINTLDNSLMFFTSFDNGYNFTDFSIYNHSITSHGSPVFNLNGKYKEGIIFDGSNDYLTIDSPIMNYSNGTISLWVYTSPNYFTPYAKIISSTLTTNSYTEWYFEQELDYNDYDFYSRVNDTALNTIYLDNLPDGWNNIIVTWYGNYAPNGSNTVLIYVNGVLNNTADTIGYYTDKNESTFIGSRNGAHGFFNGTIDELSVWNRTISENEISDIPVIRLIKNNLSSYTINVSQSLEISSSYINLTNPTRTDNFLFCSYNSTGNVNCSNTAMNMSIGNINLNANFTLLIGKVRKGFYGASNYMPFFADNAIQTCNSQYVNATWNMQTFKNSGMTIYRPRAYLDKIYLNYTNGNFVVNESEMRFMSEEAQRFWQNGIYYLVSVVNTPEFLQNRSSSYCNASFWASCPINNLTLSNELLVHFFNNITNNGQYKNVIFEVGNENYGQDKFQAYWDFGFLNTVNWDNITKAIEYFKWYNSSYDAIKLDANLSWMSVVGPVSNSNSTPNFNNYFIQNVGNRTDGIDVHWYEYTPTNQLALYAQTKYLKEQCAIYGANCSWIIWSEWDVGTWKNYNSYAIPYGGSDAMHSSLNRVNELSSSYGQTFYSILNNYPSDVSLIKWNWGAQQENVGWTDIVVQPQCSVTYLRYSPYYNLTQYYSQLCGDGSDVYKSAIDSCILVTTCNKGTEYGIILDNICPNSYNISNFNITGLYPYNNVTNLKTKKVYNIVNNKIDFSSQGDDIMDSWIPNGSNNMVFLSSGIPPTIVNIQPANLTTNITSTINFSANLSDDVGLNNATLNIMNNSDKTLIAYFVEYIAGEISVIQSFAQTLLDGIYWIWWSLFDDEGKQTVSGNYTLYVKVPSNITFQPPTPSNSSIVTSTSQTIVANVSDSPEQNTSSFIDFDNSLLGYYSFDYYNTTHIFDNSSYKKNGTIINGRNISINGSRGSSLMFNRSSYVKINSALTNYSNGTISLWVYTSPNYFTAYTKLFSSTLNTSDYNEWYIEQDNGYNDYAFYSRNSTGSLNVIRALDLPDGWNNIVLTWNGTYQIDKECNMWMYSNGVLQNPTDYICYYTNKSMFTYIGSKAGSGNEFNGSIDEVLVFNRTFNQAEIKSLRSSQINLFNSTIYNLKDGWHNYTVYSIDSAGSFNSVYQTFDSKIYPTFITIPNNQSLNYGNESLGVWFNATDETGFGYYSVNNTIFQFNSSGFLSNKTATPIGNYSLNITINDSSNNINWTIFTLEIKDTIFPTISFTEPTTNSSNFSQSNIYLNITSSDLSNHSVLSNIGLKLWLRYNNESGENNTYVLDYSGYGNNFTGYNGTISNSSGKLGSAMHFNGSSYLKEITNDSSLNISKAITLQSWVKLDSYETYKRIVVKSKDSNTYPYNMYGLMTYENKSGKAMLRMELASGGHQYYIVTSSGIQLGQWYLLTGTYDGNNTKLYLNGTLDNSTLFEYYVNNSWYERSNLETGKIDTNNVPLTIGGSYFNADFLNGSIDDVLIYDRALSLNEIQAYYNATRLDHNITNLPDGNYNLTAYAQDVYGNVNSTSRWVTLDTTPPLITITNPKSGIVEYADPTNLHFNTSENTSCAYSLDGSLNVSITSSNNQNYQKSFYLGNGVHSLRIFCNDTIGNQNLSGAFISFEVSHTSGSGGQSGSEEDEQEQEIPTNQTQTTPVNETQTFENINEKLNEEYSLFGIDLRAWVIIIILAVLFLIILIIAIVDSLRHKK